jgi:hypothetical protein
VLAGTYNVALVVDGKTVDTRPLRVANDPDVALTALERKKLFDMAMEMHELQRVGNDVTGALTPFNTAMTQLVKDLASHNDIPADVKAQFDAINKQLAAVMPKFAAGGGGRGGGAGGAGGAGAAGAQPAGGGRGAAPTPSVIARLGQAKNGLMGGMWPTEQTMKAYTDSRTDFPKAVTEVNAVFTKAAGLATALAKYNVTLDVPAPIKFVAPATKTTTKPTASQ